MWADLIRRTSKCLNLHILVGFETLFDKVSVAQASFLLGRWPLRLVLGEFTPEMHSRKM
ncbi:hypothetical protein HPP92_006612 [Vanilla planifolia]|uniref:Uncharacterized protein n=1 Tax=Vanilla planifolia TaxID=51239 RepID=A0A835RIR1_VANPL|nr:hypothetical protein HPP92_006876 [Vanilla planifolia]KAG0489749.1 hypothetical protein HPP92_006612 [Vanilla planifolia]